MTEPDHGEMWVRTDDLAKPEPEPDHTFTVNCGDGGMRIIFGGRWYWRAWRLVANVFAYLVKGEVRL